MFHKFKHGQSYYQILEGFYFIELKIWKSDVIGGKTKEKDIRIDSKIGLKQGKIIRDGLNNEC